MFRFIERERSDYNVTHMYVDNIETKWNIKFPQILRTYYTEHNRAIIKEIPFEVRGLEFCLEFILPLTNANITVERIMRVNETDEWIPKTYIPLAKDVDSDYYYWDSESGKVLYLSMGNVEQPIPVCESVEKFFELLNASC